MSLPVQEEDRCVRARSGAANKDKVVMDDMFFSRPSGRAVMQHQSGNIENSHGGTRAVRPRRSQGGRGQRGGRDGGRGGKGGGWEEEQCEFMGR